MRCKAIIALLAVTCCYGAGGSYVLIGWNDLGMHCMDGDYSLYAILPPYNTIHAQLIDPGGKLVKAAGNITVTYQAIADPAGSINTSSAWKTNFWQFAKAIFGAGPAVETGLTGNAMPGAKNQAQPMKFEPAQNWFTADGIPLTPYDDTGAKNYYPMMRLTARDGSGQELAHTDIVLPVSDEMDCSACHASGTHPSARPRAGWANDSVAQRDYKVNILRKHDELQAASAAFQQGLAANGYNPQGLYATAVGDGRPILCAGCHASNALGAAGQPDTPALTASIHAYHATIEDLATGVTLGDSSNRSACYRCHPGAETRCLRGVMGNSAAADGTLAIQCQSCHGTMADVGAAARQGWFNEPNCQNCHTGTAAKNAGQLRYTTALDAAGKLRTAVDQTFATQANVPAAGLSLYRFSTGHGGLACEACHGSTHAEYPSSHGNDNVQSAAVQGHAGVLVECGACHAAIPATGTGPHGMHVTGSAWVSQHQNAARNAAACQSCHGTDYRGTALSRSFSGRTLNTSLAPPVWAGFQIGCYTCHSGPANDNRNSNGAPAVTAGTLSTAPGASASLTIAASDPNANPLTLWVVSQPANGTAGLNGTVATFRPAGGFEGSDSFTVAAWDGMTSSNLATVQVKVAAASRPAVTSVVNAAGATAGAIAPGELVTIWGTGLGPAAGAGMFINSAGLVNRGTAGTRVLFDAVAAPVLYASATQVNAVAPWALAGKSSTSIQVEAGGIASASWQASVGTVSPAIFANAMVNVRDGSMNPGAAVARGDYLTVYATGAGAMDQPAIDGEFAGPPYGAVAGAVTAQIGGVDAAVTYAGDAPGLVSGAVQINIQAPANAPTGSAVPLVLKIGGVAAPAVNIAVK
jgi:uncharacterized protein (TIGR03437 family)